MNRTIRSHFISALSTLAIAINPLAGLVRPADAACPPLLAPANVTATQNGCNLIIVQWNPVDGTNGYNITRTDPDNSQHMLQDHYLYEYYQDSPSLINGAVYKYTIRAHLLSGSDDCLGPAAPAVSGRTMKKSVAPAGFAITDVGGQTINLTWSPVPDASDYFVYRRELITGPLTLIRHLLSGQTLSLNYDEVECGTHRYSVTSYNACYNESAESFKDHPAPNFPTSGPPIAPPLNAPINNALICNTSTTLSWGTGCLATQYRVQLSASSTFATLLIDQLITNIVARSVTAGGLAPSTTYYWRVQSVNGAGSSAWTSTNFHTGKVPSFPLIQSPWVMRSNPYDYRQETQTIDLAPDAGGCACSYTWTLLNGRSENYATNGAGTHGFANNIWVLSTFPLTYRIVASNAFGTAPSFDYGWTLIAGSRPAGGCPYVAPWNGTAFVDENNLLPESEWAGNQGRSVSDYYALQNVLVAEDGIYKIKLREFENESSQIDQVRLLYVDHPADVGVSVDEAGAVTGYSPTGANVFERAGSSSAPLFDARDPGTSRKLSPGQNLLLQFPSATGGDATPPASPALIVRGAAPFKVQAVGTAQGFGASIAGSFTFRERTSPALVRLGSGSVSDVRLSIQQGAELQDVELVNVLDTPLKLTEAPMAELRHSSAAKQSVLDRSTGGGMTLDPGEEIELRFTAAPLAEGMDRTFVLYSRGRYQRSSEALAAKAPAKLEYLMERPRSLGNPEVTFEFGLARQENLVLTIHDVQGREVARLLQGPVGDGSHNVSWRSSDVASGVYFAQLRATLPAGGSRMIGRTKIVLLGR
ncbi:MAG: fibronectin type III domain-containing protein [Candidatus Eiseniibacteriota bacterium]